MAYFQEICDYLLLIVLTDALARLTSVKIMKKISHHFIKVFVSLYCCVVQKWNMH